MPHDLMMIITEVLMAFQWCQHKLQQLQRGNHCGLETEMMGTIRHRVHHPHRHRVPVAEATAITGITDMKAKDGDFGLERGTTMVVAVMGKKYPPR